MAGRVAFACALAVLACLPTPLHAQENSATLGTGDILGTDFVSGSAATDIASYAVPFVTSTLSFEFTSQWTQGTFLVRDTDRNGLPLLGTSASGEVDGALIAYRLGLKTRDYLGLRGFLIADYFVASHLDSFFQLLTPSAVTPGNHINGEWNTGYRGRYYLTWLVPLGLVDGGGRTGFAARAFQLLPGLSLELPGIGLGVQAGVIIRYRDPVDEDGRFISRHYLSRYPSDYRSEDDIPDGVDGEERTELFLAGQLYGVNVDTLFTPGGSLAFFSLARDLVDLFPADSRVQELTPRLTFLDALAQEIRDREVINPSISASFDTPIRDFPLVISPTLSWLQGPIAFRSTTLELSAFGLVAGAGLQDHPDKGLLPGLRVGIAPQQDRLEWLVLDLRYNYPGGGVGGLEVLDRTIFTLELRF